MCKPEISVIMSVYNGEEYLSETLESIVAQTFSEWELIAINDCSKDSTEEILNKYAKLDKRIKVFTNETNLRLPASLNKAISLSSGKYIARMDADDICLPDRLEKQYKFMEENKDISLSCPRFMTLKNGVYSSGGCGGRCDNEALKARLLLTNPILHPGVISRAEVMKKLGYDTARTCTEDLDLWTRMAAEGYKMEIQPEYLLIYRLHDKQITSTTMEKQHKEVLVIEDKYYENILQPMREEDKEFFIGGIYFRENVNVEKYLSFLKWLRLSKSKSIAKKHIDYAMFEVLTEYKRCGISKKDIIKIMLNFSPVFLAKELIRRKKCAARDGRKCLEAAEKIGLRKTAGNNEFPIFEKAGRS